jgi:hypothetical protein
VDGNGSGLICGIIPAYKEQLRNITKTQSSQPPDLDLNPRPADYKAEMPNTPTRRSVTHKECLRLTELAHILAT